MVNLWTLGGLSLPELLRRTIRESWHDSVFGQGGRMAFYHFLAIFPTLLVVLAFASSIPRLDEHLKTALADLSSQLLPTQVSQLLQTVLNELHARSISGFHLASAVAGATWAALNGTWAMIYGLNRAYEVEERRVWWKLALTIVGLTLWLSVAGSISLFFVFCSVALQSHLHASLFVVRSLEWLVLVFTLLLSFGILYRFAPNLRDHKWRWSTPGALCALVLWVGATFAARLYFDHVNNYARSYGHLNGAVMLLLWLYVTNGAILIGGEMNSEIEKAAAEGDDPSRAGDRSGT